MVAEAELQRYVWESTVRPDARKIPTATREPAEPDEHLELEQTHNDAMEETS